MRHTLAVALTLLLAAAAFAEAIPVAPRTTGPSPESNGSATIVPSGSDFVVIWWSFGTWRFARIRHADEVLLTGELPPGNVESAVAGPDGSVLVALSQGDGIHIAAIATNGDVNLSRRVAPSFSSMAANGSRLLIVTKDGSTVLTNAGGYYFGNGVRFDLGFDHRSSTSARGTGFVVAWPEENGYVVTTLTNKGTLVREQRLGEDRQIGNTAIGCNPAGTCLLLTSVREPLSGQILSGSTAGPTFWISEDLVAEAVEPMWDGERFLVVWNDYTFPDNIMHVVLRIDAVSLDGTVSHVAAFASEEVNRGATDVARANGETVIVYTESNHCGAAGSQIMVRSLATNHELRLTHGLSEQSEPAIIGGHSGALVAWAEQGGTARIRAREFPFDEPAFEISGGLPSLSPVIGTDGSHYLVAWRTGLPDQECRGALQITIAGSGEIHTLGLDAASIVVTWNGSEYVVMWEQDDPAQIFAMRVDRDGRPIDDAPVPLSTPEADPDAYTHTDHRPLVLFWTGDGYTLLWRRSHVAYIPFFPDPLSEFDVRMTRLAPNLIPAGQPQVIAPVSDAVATRKGDSIVAVWTSNDTRHAVRLTPDGTIVADRQLDIPPLADRIVPTRSGVAILIWNEVIFLDNELMPAGRRATGGQVTFAETSEGLIEVSVEDHSVVVTTPGPRRRRAVR
ncbi:MAG TPA: hypothetical protein VGD79_06160 [Thermoanaerobaculia bacterium]